MKTILLWDPRFPDRSPARLALDDALASAAVRAGVAAAADPADQAALATGPLLSASPLVEAVISHGPDKQPLRHVLPQAVALAGVALGVAAIVAVIPVAVGDLLPPFGFVILVDSTGAVLTDTDGAIFVEPA